MLGRIPSLGQGLEEIHCRLVICVFQSQGAQHPATIIPLHRTEWEREVITASLSHSTLCKLGHVVWHHPLQTGKSDSQPDSHMGPVQCRLKGIRGRWWDDKKRWHVTKEGAALTTSLILSKLPKNITEDKGSFLRLIETDPKEFHRSLYPFWTKFCPTQPHSRISGWKIEWTKSRNILAPLLLGARSIQISRTCCQTGSSSDCWPEWFIYSNHFAAHTGPTIKILHHLVGVQLRVYFWVIQHSLQQFPVKANNNWQNDLNLLIRLQASLQMQKYNKRVARMFLVILVIATFYQIF